ncbi:hypothetical protein LJR235_002927 [Pararhizobium sp. LjRoot235]|uniref:hypothetical protein n=1 Tax=Pararhizobium sp. LjRoot235 TaxID=3342291 RepID=UPI003ED00DA4
MTVTTTVRSHQRRKPEKPQVYVDTHVKLRAEVAEMKRVNDFRDSVDYQPGTNALLLIAGRLKVLALLAKELVQ